MKCRSHSFTVYNNEFILDSGRVSSEMINWIATNTIGNYCLSKSHTCHSVSSLLQRVLRMCSSSTNASGRHSHYSLTAGLKTCISQGSIATVVRWDGQNYSHLHRVSSWCRTWKITKNQPTFNRAIQKIKAAHFYGPSVLIRYKTIQ